MSFEGVEDMTLRFLYGRSPNALPFSNCDNAAKLNGLMGRGQSEEHDEPETVVVIGIDNKKMRTIGTLDGLPMLLGGPWKNELICVGVSFTIQHKLDVQCR